MKLKPAMREENARATSRGTERFSGVRRFKPLIPDERVARGMIWPPAGGRAVLRGIAGKRLELQRLSNGDWSGLVNQCWRVHSYADAASSELEEAHALLIKWARMHAASVRALSEERCIALADDGLGNYRLWQIVRIEPSLQYQLVHAMRGTPEALIGTLLSCTRTFMQAAQRLSEAACELPLDLRYLRTGDAGAVFLGLMPDPSFARPAKSRSEAVALKLLTMELEFMRPAVHERRPELLAALDKMPRSSPTGSVSAWLLVRRLIDSP